MKYLIFYNEYGCSEVEVNFRLNEKYARNYYNKLKNSPKRPVKWAQLILAYDDGLEEYEILDEFNSEKIS